MSVLLQHRALRILWQLPVTSYFAPLWGPPSSGNTLSSSLFSGLCQPWLQLIFSRSTFMQLPLTPLFCVTQLHSELLWGLHGCLFPMSGVSQFWGVLFSFPTSAGALGGGWVLSFYHQWGDPPRTCGFECLLNECSNPVSLVQNV